MTFLVSMNLPPIVCATVLAFILSSFAQGSEVEFYRANGYKLQPVPQEWLPANSGGSIPDIREVVATFRPDGNTPGDFSIKGFITRYGMPDQYWARASGKRDWDYLVYTRPDGTIVIYVPKPPGTNFGAVAIWDRTGQLLNLIK